MAKLEWTKEVPTKDGWYWCDEPGEDLMCLNIQHDTVLYPGVRRVFNIVTDFNKGTQWYGPISVPE